MMSDLSIFAARLRDFISICTEEFESADAAGGAESLAHADAEFNGMALVLFALQFEHNLPYRKFCEARKVFPNAVTHWTQIPTVPTAAFKELELTCLSPRERITVFHSSGTTDQKPSRHFHSAESLAVYEASLWPWFAMHMLESPEANGQSPIANSQTPSLNANRRSALNANRQSALDANRQSPIADSQGEIGNWRLAVLAPPPAEAPHSSLVHMFETIRKSTFRRSEADSPAEGGTPNDVFMAEASDDGAWVLNFEKCLAAVRGSIADKQPLLLLGTAFSFVHLLDQVVDRTLRFVLPPGSRVMETGGYKGRARTLSKVELHSLITGLLGIPGTHIVSEYGMSELSSQAYDCRLAGLNIQHSTSNVQLPTPDLERLFRFPPWTRFQIISPESGREVADGETGLLRIFDLANVFSVMAVQTEDLAVRRGAGFELIGRAELAEPRGCSLMAVE